MRRIIIDAYGPPSVMKLVDATVPEPGERDVIVEVTAAGVNVVDLLQRSGVYTVGFPFTPGFEGSGVVVRTGGTVTEVAEGDRVAWAGAPGSYATHCRVPVERLVPVPAAIDLIDAAAVLIHGMTAHVLVSDVVALGQGDVCLVHAAAGGVGGLLCQLAVERGATVIGAVSKPEKVTAARDAGAGHVIVTTREDFAARVAEITGGRGVDVVYDAAGRDTFEQGLTCLRPRGTFVLYGQSGGAVDAISPQALNARGSLFFTKPSLGHYDRTRASLLRRAGEVFGRMIDGRLRVRVHGVYPLDRVADAHESIESRASMGKVVLRP